MTTTHFDKMRALEVRYEQVSFTEEAELHEAIDFDFARELQAEIHHSLGVVNRLAEEGRAGSEEYLKAFEAAVVAMEAMADLVHGP